MKAILLKEKITIIICRTVIKESSEKELKAQEQQRQNQKMNAFHESMEGNVAPENKVVENNVENISNMQWKNISRNSLCPCGSGKKFKHCHGKVA